MSNRQICKCIMFSLILALWIVLLWYSHYNDCWSVWWWYVNINWRFLLLFQLNRKRINWFSFKILHKTCKHVNRVVELHSLHSNPSINLYIYIYLQYINENIEHYYNLHHLRGDQISLVPDIYFVGNSKNTRKI